MRLLPLAGIAAAVIVGGPALAQPKPASRAGDGSYACQAWMGNSYVSFGKVRLAGGRLNPDPIAKVGGKVTGIAPTKEGVTVSYTTARGYRESMDCKRG